jgi:hypothetical protein
VRARLLALLVAGVGCAPSLSTFQPAQVAPKGHLAASIGVEAGTAVGALDTLFDTAKELADRGQMGQPLTDDEKWKIFDAGVNLLLVTPSFGPHLAAAYTPVNRLEVGLRYAGGAWRLGGRYQLLEHATAPVDLTVGVGVAHFSYEFPISDQIPVLKLDDFSRWQIDIPILAGTSRDWFRVWAGPKILFTKFETQLTLTLPSEQTVATFNGTATFIGGQGGVALGYRKLFLAFELTLAEGFGTAHLTAVGLNPPTHDTSVSSFTVFPSFGLMGEL